MSEQPLQPSSRSGSAGGHSPVGGSVEHVQHPASAGLVPSGGYGKVGAEPDPATASGPPWPRLVATSGAYTPPMLLRWPVVIGALFSIAPFAGVASESSSMAPSSAPPHVFTASDAGFTATFPGKPERSVEPAAGMSLILYTSTLRDHAVGVGYLSGPVPADFNLDGALAGFATSIPGGKLVSRNSLTYRGQPAEDGLVSFSGGIGQVRVVDVRSRLYILEGLGSSHSSFAPDYQTLLSTFATAAEAAPAATSPSASSPSAGTPSAGTLASEVIPAPEGFAVSQATGVANGPVDSAGFDSFLGAKGLASQLHYVTGQQVTYDSLQGTDTVEVALFQFADASDAASLVTGFSLGSDVKTDHDAALAGATAFDSATADGSGAYQHGLIAARGDTVMIVDYTNTSAARPPAVDDLARQQYGRLRSS